VGGEGRILCLVVDLHLTVVPADRCFFALPCLVRFDVSSSLLRMRCLKARVEKAVEAALKVRQHHGMVLLGIASLNYIFVILHFFLHI